VNGEYQLQTRLDGRWTPMYQISLAEQTAADWEMANWYVSTSPNSMFTNTLMVARSTAHGRYALRNNRLRIYRDDGTTDERIIGSAGELIETLRGDFNLKLPPSEELTAIASIAGV
jgi:N-hydroxyarylamine O-acetyltransferase